MFIVIPLHRESLRIMMNQGLVSHSIKVQVMEMLKRLVIDVYFNHGDIKVFLVFIFSSLTLIQKPKNEPENILVDYDLNGAVVSNFACILADWGTAGDKHFGGTPLYAGPNTYEFASKDLFSFGRLSLELFLGREGKS